MACAAFGKMSYIVISREHPQYFKTKVYNQWYSLFSQTQWLMGRQMLHVKLTDIIKHKGSENIKGAGGDPRWAEQTT